jgi:NADPH dehydrogenase (quinone)
MARRQNAGKEVHDLRDLECSERSFDNPNGVLYAGKGTADLHITSTGYDILPDYGVFDIFKSPDIPRALEDYKRHLEKHCL